MMHYEYYTGFCICDGVEVYIAMKTRAGLENRFYPVTVYNVNEVAIGTATNKAQYLTIWNADLDNRAVGILSGIPGPFSFSLTVKPGQATPAFVIGEQDGAGLQGIFSNQFSSQFA